MVCNWSWSAVVSPNLPLPGPQLWWAMLTSTELPIVPRLRRASLLRDCVSVLFLLFSVGLLFRPELQFLSTLLLSSSPPHSGAADYIYDYTHPLLPPEKRRSMMSFVSKPLARLFSPSRQSSSSSSSSSTSSSSSSSSSSSPIHYVRHVGPLIPGSSLPSNHYITRCTSPFSLCSPQYFFLSPLGELIHGTGPSPSSSVNVLFKTKARVRVASDHERFVLFYDHSGELSLRRITRFSPLLHTTKDKTTAPAGGAEGRKDGNAETKSACSKPPAQASFERHEDRAETLVCEQTMPSSSTTRLHLSSARGLPSQEDFVSPSEAAAAKMQPSSLTAAAVPTSPPKDTRLRRFFSRLRRLLPSRPSFLSSSPESSSRSTNPSRSLSSAASSLLHRFTSSVVRPFSSSRSHSSGGGLLQAVRKRVFVSVVGGAGEIKRRLLALWPRWQGGGVDKDDGAQAGDQTKGREKVVWKKQVDKLTELMPWPIGK